MTRPPRPVGYWVYGSPDGPGRFVPAETRARSFRRRLYAWLRRPAWTYGDVVSFVACGVMAAALVTVVGFRKGAEAAFLIVANIVLFTAASGVIRWLSGRKDRAS